MDEWYELLEDEQEAEHDRVCNEGAECRRRDEHIQGTYIPIALKQKIERMQKEHAEEIAAAYRRGLNTSLEILSAEATSASYHGWESADEEFMRLHKKIRQEIQHPMLDRMTGNPKAEGRYDDER